LINRGLIEAPFTFVHLETQMGPCFKSEPEQGVIPPGETQTVQVFCDATVVGHLEEDLQFNVAGCPIPVIIKVEGDVCPPDIEFSGDNLDFCDVSFGFPKTLSIRLTNKSPGYFKFRLRVTGDGRGHAVSSYELITNDADPAWRKGVQCVVEPQEFTMNPSEAFMHPFGYRDIQVTLCSNTIMEYYRQLVVDVERVGEAVASVTVTARCLVAKLEVYPNILWYEDICYLNEPYEKKFLIMNNTHLYGCYGLIPQKRKEGTPVFYSSRKPCGVVEPFSIAELPITLESQRVGKQSTRVM
ncbi:HYDIN protein, partial [Grantiella picta]|nr:HYDIN protein [Grantiella picta]